MNFLRWFSVISVSISLSACNTGKSEAERAILTRLKDPDSAKFGKFTKVDAENACYTVNARNSYGGYVGDKEAVLLKVADKWKVVDFIDISHDSCIKLLKQAVEEDASLAEGRKIIKREEEQQQQKEAL